jgi:hypothetical protein
MVEAFESEFVFHQLDTGASLSWGLYVQQLTAPDRRHLGSSNKENRDEESLFFTSGPLFSPHVPWLGLSLLESNMGLVKTGIFLCGHFLGFFQRFSIHV